jgi:hypothetical protein
MEGRRSKISARYKAIEIEKVLKPNNSPPTVVVNELSIPGR